MDIYPFSVYSKILTIATSFEEVAIDRDFYISFKYGAFVFACKSTDYLADMQIFIQILPYLPTEQNSHLTKCQVPSGYEQKEAHHLLPA